MSSNKNDESTAIATGVAVIGVILMTLALIIVVLLAFAAFVLTIFAIVAWNEPLKLGKVIIMPEEARSFVRRGIVGAVMVPAFVAFMSMFLNLNIDWNLLPHFMLGGYVGGSIGLELVFLQDKVRGGPVNMSPPPPNMPAPPVRRLLPPTDPKPFRYASWDDEEEQGR